MATAIAPLVRSSFGQWRELVSSGQLAACNHEVPLALWEDELGRLRLWIANIGAHQSRQSSLDYRLRDASHIKDQVIRVLRRLQRLHEDLRDTLIGLNEAGEEVSEGSEEEGEEESETDLQQIYRVLRDTVDCLFQLSLAIRQPAHHDPFTRVKRADAAHFEYYDRQHVQSKYPQISEAISDRLGAAISLRRAVLQYYERHHLKLSEDPDKVLSDAVSATKLSETVASEYIPKSTETLEADSQISQTSYSESAFQGSGGLAIPSLPDGSTYGIPFECPYCFFLVNVANKHNWARHVFNDLKPYVCVIPDCQIPHRLYESRREWYAHMQAQHRMSLSAGDHPKCLLCGSRLSPGEVLEKHVARHLEELALFALPRPDTADEEASCTSLSSSHEEQSPGVDLLEERPPSEDDEENQTVSERVSAKDIGVISDSEDDDSLIQPVFLVGHDGHKLRALMALDTQASANLLNYELCKHLRLPMEPAGGLVLRVFGGSASVVPRGILKDVTWRFAAYERTYISDFVVVEMKHYDAILGRRSIQQYNLISRGPSTVRETLS